MLEEAVGNVPISSIDFFAAGLRQREKTGRGTYVAKLQNAFDPSQQTQPRKRG